MKTLIHFASVMEAFLPMYPVDPRSDRFGPTGLFALAGAGSPSAFAQA